MRAIPRARRGTDVALDSCREDERDEGGAQPVSVQGVVVGTVAPRLLAPPRCRQVLVALDSSGSKVGIDFAAHPQGVEVTKIFAGYAAAQSQLRVGDVIVSINGQTLDRADTFASAIVLLRTNQKEIILHVLEEVMSSESAAQFFREFCTRP